MKNKQFEQALTQATEQIAHADNVADYRERFYKLSQEAHAVGVAVEYMIKDRPINVYATTPELEEMAETVGEVYATVTDSKELDIFILANTIRDVYPVINEIDRKALNEKTRNYLATAYNIK